MLRGPRLALGGLAALATFAAAARAVAEPSTAWLAAGPAFTPVEQRLAIAAGPTRTTVWTSLRFDASAGPVAIVVPVPPGAALDRSSDAWFEALEVATAPRVLPPAGESAACPGKKASGPSADVAGHVEHFVTLSPDEIAILPTAAALEAWAGAQGLGVAAATKTALEGLVGERFLAARFTSQGGQSLSPTFRVVLPGAQAVLPLALTRAGGADLAITAFVLGGGRASLVGALDSPLDPLDLRWNASTGRSTYLDARDIAFDLAGPAGATLEASGHSWLVETTPVVSGVTIDGVVTTYFERAAAYGALGPDVAGCIALASAALSSSSVVAPSCPRADLGVVDGAPGCVESPPADALDPAKLRCGSASDDLAVALSGLSPASAWLTRIALRVAPGQAGSSFPVALGVDPALSPVRLASAVDLAGCGGAGGGGGAGTGSGSGTSSGSGSGTGSGSGSGSGTGSGSGSGYGNGPQPSQDPGGGVGGDEPAYDATGDVASAVVDGVVSSGCDCSGTTDTTASDGGSSGCSSDTSGSSDSGSSGCSSDTSGSSDSGSGCSSDTSSSSSSSSCDGSSSSSSSSDGCSGGSSGSDAGCSSSSGSSGSSCSVSPNARRARMPKLSAMSLGLILLLAPLRRATRRRRKR